MKSRIHINIKGNVNIQKDGYVNSHFIYIIRTDTNRKLNKIYSIDMLLTNYLVLELSL